MRIARRLPPLALDALLAAGFFVAAVVAMNIALNLGWYPWNIANFYAIAIMGALAILGGRRWPLATLIVVAVLVCWPTWWFDFPELRALPLLFALYRSTAAGVRMYIAFPVLALTAMPVLIPGFFDSLPAIFEYGDALNYIIDPSRRILTGVVLVAAILLGAAAYRQRRATDELRRRNEELIRLRSSDRARIAAEERTALARDIHDVVAHHVSAMVIRAQAADRLADTEPQDLRAAVRGIAADGKEALASMRRVVRVLRAADHASADGLPLAEAIEDVAARVREAGIEVDSDVRVPGELTEFEEATVLRITQEALTNVLLHSSARRVRVGLRGDASGLHLEVVDDGGAVDAPSDDDATGGGNGLRGMRERAGALGGSVTAGPVDGGWRVAADLPLREGRAA